MSELKAVYNTITGFESPNYTQSPNDFFDMIPDMSDAELRVTLVMIRNTFGWHKTEFKMGVSKLADAAGLSRQGALDGASAAEKRGTFRRLNPEAITEAEWELVTLNPVEGTPLASRGGTLNPVEDSLGLKKDKKISKESSLTPEQHSQLSQFVDRFGKFNNTQEAETILALFEKHGNPKMLEVFDWVFKKEIHLTNRPSLVDSIQTAAERWSGRKERKNAGNPRKRNAKPTPEVREDDIQVAIAALQRQASHV